MPKRARLVSPIATCARGVLERLDGQLHIDNNRMMISSAWGSPSEPVGPSLPIGAPTIGRGVCLISSFENASYENDAAALIRQMLPGCSRLHWAMSLLSSRRRP
jgi:hypothetical protein